MSPIAYEGVDAWRSCVSGELENPLPTLFRDGPYRFFFYSNEGDSREPPRVHMAAGMKVATFLYGRLFSALGEPDRDHVLLEDLTSSRRMRTDEIASLRHVVERHQKTILEMWRDRFDA